MSNPSNRWIKRFKTKLLYKYIISYLFMLIVPFIVGFVYYQMSFSIISENVKESNQRIIEQTKDVINRQLIDVKDSAFSIANNSKLRFYASLDDPYNYISYKEMLETSQMLGVSQFGNELVNHFFVYFSNSNLVMSSNSVTNFEDYYGVNFYEENMNANQWIEENIKNVEKSEYLVKRNIHYQNKKFDSIPYVFSAYESNNSASLDVVFLINVNKIKEMIEKNSYYSEADYYVYDEYNELIVNTSNNSEENRIQDLLYEDKIEGMVKIVVQSPELNWRYVVLIPEEMVYNQVNSIRRTTIVVFMISILFGVLIAVYISYRNSKPINEIYGMLQRKIDSDQNENDGVIDFIKKSTKEILEKQNDLSRLLESKKPFIQSAFIDKLINGGFEDEKEILSNMEFLEFNMKSKFFCTMIISSYSRLNSNEELLVNRIRFIDVLDTFFDKQNIIISNLDDGSVLLFLGLTHSSKDKCKEFVNMFIKKVTSIVRDSLSLEISFSCGDFTNTLLEVPSSYIAARQVFEYHKISDKIDVVWFDEIDNEYIKPYYPVLMEQNLMNLLKLGKEDEIRRWTETIYDENIRKRKLSIGSYRQFLCEFKATMYKVIDRYPDLFDDNVVLDNIDESNSIKELFEIFDDVVTKICRQEKIIKEENTTSSQMIDAFDYLNKNYMNPNISLRFMADKFNITEIYFSQLFKKEIGETFINYLQKVRLEKAAVMLKESNKSVKEIAHNCGYVNAKTFHRAFKRIYNLSPTEYRKS